MKSTIQLSPSKHLDNISKMFKKLYNDEQLTDCTLCCKDGTIKAHKIILATSSPYFHKIFTENNRDHPIVVMHGISYQHLHDLIELIYKGHVDVLAESLNPLYELAGEFQLTGVSGILREEEGEKTNEGSESESQHGRDTRYKGLKRVAVDYLESGESNIQKEPDTPTSANDNSKDDGQDLQLLSKEETATEDKKENSDLNEETKKEEPKLSAWAKKQRKFQCDLCPSSFKRSSHLTRHQLVHTGERPYACDQCDKAFSRHDKLKHHIRKTHENFYEDYATDYAATDYENDYTLETVDQIPANPSPPPFVISNVRTETEGEATPAKRPRGRPRKYPIVEKPRIKRGRGRPRLNPVPPAPNGENYDITNLPYGDIEYLTMPLQQSDDQVMIEPLVEINTEAGEKDNSTNASQEKPEKNKEIKCSISSIITSSTSNSNNIEIKQEEEDKISQTKEVSAEEADLRIFENKLAKIGECTIEIANQ